MTDPMTTTPVLERTIAAVLDRQTAAMPDKPALIEETGRTITFAELQQEAFRIANGIAALGVERGEHVALLLDNHIDIVATWAGLGCSGRVAVPLNTAYKGDFLRHVLAHCAAKVVIVEDKYCERLAAIADQLPDLKVVVVRGDNGEVPERFQRREFAELTAAEPVRPEPPHVSDISAIIYTSGTEGAAKGVLCPHGHAFQTSASYSFQTTPDDIVLVMLPLFHAGGLFAGVYNALRGGATAILHPTFTVSRFWDEVRRYGCTQSLLMGAMIDFLWRQPATAEDRNHPMRNLTVVPAMPYIKEFGERFGLNVVSSYGQSETGTTTITAPEDTRPFMCGRPRPFIEMKVVDDDDVEVPTGVVGEFVARSNEPWAMFRGYLRDPEATVVATRNGWMHTGDAGYKDEEGRFVFADRKRDSLRRRGENVSSIEVERFLMARADIAAAAVVAVPSEYLEDDIKAVVVLAPEATFEPEKILRDLVGELPYFMVPRFYEQVDALPMTPTHKVRKAELRKLGQSERTWDCEANGLIVTRNGIKEKTTS